MLAAPKEIQADGVLDTVLETAINIFLPALLAEVWLSFGENEGINSAV